MGNLFEIQKELEDIFLQVEENDGEVTVDLENKLAITEEEFKEKLSSYIKAIRYYEYNTSEIKDEKARLNALQKVRENRVQKLRNAITDAVIKFGNKSKSGNSTYELWDYKVFTKDTKSTEIVLTRVEIFKEKYFNYCRELYAAQLLDTGFEADYQGILDAINAQCIAEYGDDFILYTVGDFVNIKFTISFNMSAMELLKDNNFILKAALTFDYCTNIEFSTPKNIIKDYIENVDDRLTIAYIQNNTSINIK